MRTIDPDDLSRFRYHTGATLRRVDPDEACPLLYRDIGPEAMVRFLDGRLERLAGPLAPILYSRTARFREPFTDHAPVGRLVFLQPHELRPWFSGIAEVYVAPVRWRPTQLVVGFLPAHVDPSRADTLLVGLRRHPDFRDALGGSAYDEACVETRAALDRLNRDLAETETLAEPMRRKLQSRSRDEADAARAWLDRHRLTESDLCTAWHHLPRERRDLLRDALGLGRT
jgi:hypothetical protein